MDVMTKRRVQAAVAVAVWVMGAVMLSAQGAPGPLVSTAWVADQLKSPDLVVLHVGPPANYPAAHLPGARLVQPSAISVSSPSADGGTLSLQMPDAETLRANLAGLGISDSSRVVVYVAVPAWTAMSTRVLLTLQQAGLGDRAHLMQGGMATWVAEGRPTTEVVPAVTPGSLSPLNVVPMTVDAEAVEAQRTRPGVRIVDARAPAFYDGTQTGGSQATPHKTGHIAGAVNVPFSATYDADGRFKSVEELRAIFAAAGVKPGETLITYCHIGQQATATLFAARLAGFDVKLYDGSFEEWSRRPNAAVEIKK